MTMIEKCADIIASHIDMFYVNGAPPARAISAARAVIEALMEMDGQMWIAGRGAFVAEGEKYQKADRYEMAIAIADRAPENILRVMLRTALSQPNEEGEGK